MPGLPVPLPQHLSLPGDLTSLLPGAPGCGYRTGGAARRRAGGLTRAGRRGPVPDIRPALIRNRTEIGRTDVTQQVTCSVTTAIALGSSAALLFGGVAGSRSGGAAAAIDSLQAPGLSAVQTPQPGDPAGRGRPVNAASMLMAAAAAFAGNSAAPADSKNLASAVSQFVSEPARPSTGGAGIPLPGHVSVPGAGHAAGRRSRGATPAGPGAEAHLPPRRRPRPTPAGTGGRAAVAPQRRGGARTASAAPAPALRPLRRTRRPRRLRHLRPLPAPAPERRTGPRGRHPLPAAAPGFGPDAPVDAGLHVPVDQQRLPGRRRQRPRDRDLGGRAGQDSGAGPRRRARPPMCSPRSARPARPPSRSCR